MTPLLLCLLDVSRPPCSCFHGPIARDPVPLRIMMYIIQPAPMCAAPAHSINLVISLPCTPWVYPRLKARTSSARRMDPSAGRRLMARPVREACGRAESLWLKIWASPEALRPHVLSTQSLINTHGEIDRQSSSGLNPEDRMPVFRGGNPREMQGQNVFEIPSGWDAAHLKGGAPSPLVGDHMGLIGRGL